MAYQPRIVDQQLRDLLDRYPAVTIEGARGIGKTTTAKQVAATVFSLERADVLQEVQANPAVIADAPAPVLLDEWHLFPAAMNTVKHVVDEGRQPGRFILTGSPGRPVGRDTHSGIARVVPLRMRPMSLAERQIETPTVSLGGLLDKASGDISGTTDLGKLDYASALLKSGYPQCFGEPLDYSFAFVEGYIEQLTRQDMQNEAVTARQTAPGPILRWLAGYARATATEAKFKTIVDWVHSQDGETPARATTDHYRTVLGRLGVLEEQPSWKQPSLPIPKCKTSILHHLVDPALAAHLMDIGAVNDLLKSETRNSDMAAGKSVFGLLFQSLVTQSIRVYAAANDAQVYWLATAKHKSRSQHEIDIIVRNRRGKVVGVEVKLNNLVDDDDVRHLRWLRRELGSTWSDGVVIYTGSEAYRRSDGIGVVPASLLGP